MNMSIKKFMTKKVVVVGAAVALTLGLSGTAFAYFTSSNQGTGHATVGSATNWTLVQTSITGLSASNLEPEALGANITTEIVHYTVQNSGGATQTLTNTTVAVDPAYNFVDGANDPACNASDFSLGGNAVGVPYVNTTGAGSFVAGHTSNSLNVTIELVDNGLNQDSCEGQSLPLIFTAN
jgi:hypothetical protein